MNPACYAPPAIFSFMTDGFFAQTSVECQMALSQTSRVHPLSIIEYALLFLLTAILETPIYLLFLRSRSPKFAQMTLMVIIINIATHPAVIFLFPWYFARRAVTQGATLFFAELFAFVVEGWLLILLFKQEWRRAFAAAFCANLFSWWLGLYLLNYITF